MRPIFKRIVMILDEICQGDAEKYKKYSFVFLCVSVPLWLILCFPVIFCEEVACLGRR